MQGLLFASFGTSYDMARERGIDALAAYLAENLPGYTLKQGYTSNMVRRILEKRGICVPDVKTALTEMAAESIDRVLIQPGHLLPGEEYDKLCAQAEACRGLFAALHIGAPLLASTADLRRVATILSERYPAQDDTCLVLMGHGTPQFANCVYAALDYHFKDIGRADIFVGTVEAYPGLAEVLRLIPAGRYRKVLLAPLMQVAGDHATNDLAGNEDDSWASQCKARGYEVEVSLQGLGELPAIRELYLQHARAALG